MKNHIFVRMHGMNEADVRMTEFFACAGVEEAEAFVLDWLVQKCGLECYHEGAEEEALKAANKGVIPEFSFRCPTVEQPVDLEKYNGFYFYESEGSISLFLNVIYDRETAEKFRKSVITEFELDKIDSVPADELMEMLQRLEDSFEGTVDHSEAVARVRELLLGDGLLPL